MPDNHDLLTRKLPEPELLKLAQEESDKKISVIIELDLPPQAVYFGRSNAGSGARTPKGVVEETPAQRQKNERLIEAAKDFLESLLGTTPRWLKAARAIVLMATPAQLREIAGSSLMKMIRLNRSLSA